MAHERAAPSSSQLISFLPDQGFVVEEANESRDWRNFADFGQMLIATARGLHDMNLLDEIMPEAGAFFAMDRAYIDFQRHFVFTLSSAFFVVRTESNLRSTDSQSHALRENAYLCARQGT